jgi:hypothetical protein
MLLNNFSGGLFTRIDSRLVSSQYGVVYHNIDNQTGNLEPIKDDIILQQTDKQNCINFKNNWIFSNDNFLIYKNILIKYSSNSIPQKSKDGINFYNCGIAEPTNKLSYEVIEDDINVTVTQTNDNTISKNNFNPNTEYHYIIEAYNSSTDIYSYKEIFYTTETPDDGYKIKSIDFTFTNTSLTYKIYRYVNREFKRVADNSTNYSDANSVQNETLDKHIILNGNLQYAYTYYNINDGAESRFSLLTGEIKVNSGKVKLRGFIKSNDSQVTHIRLWRIGGGLTEFTKVDEIPVENITDSYEYIDDKKDISDNEVLDNDNLGQAKEFSYMTEYNNMLFGIKDDKVYFSDIGNINAWSPYNFIEFPYTLTGLGATPNGLLVFTKFKTYIITGNSPTTLSKFLLDASQGCISYKSIQSINGLCVWASTDGICSSEGGIPIIQTMDRLGKLKLKPTSSIVFDNVYYLSCDDIMYALDTRFGQPCIRTLDGNYNSLTIYNDELYGIKNGNFVKLFSGDVKQFNYKSPKLTEQLLTMIKNYKVFYIYAEKEVNFKIYIDGELVINKQLQNGFNEIKIPQDKRLGYYIEFEINGIGKVYEIEYKAEGRQNGR